VIPGIALERRFNRFIVGQIGKRYHSVGIGSEKYDRKVSKRYEQIVS